MKHSTIYTEDLGLNPSTVEQAKFEYSPLGKSFNKGLEEEGKKEGILKRLKNIEKKLKNNNNNNHIVISVVKEVNQAKKQ